MGLRNLNFIQRLFQTPKVSWRDLFLTLLGALLWLGLTQARTSVIHTRCANEPSLCSTESVPAVDRFALSHNSPLADGLSYDTQNFSGVWAYAVPIALQIGRLAFQAEPIGLALTFVAQDALIITETVVYNGALNELARLVVQRPRPFVFFDPGSRGSNPHNYTSFYSGHTSFTAASNVALLFVMLGRHAATPWLWVVGTAGASLILATGFFRVLAGRHFFTDVLAAAIAGSLVALVIALYHRGKLRS